MILYQYLIFVAGPSNWLFPKMMYIFFNYRTLYHLLQVQKKMHSNFIGIDIVWNENEKCQKHFHLVFIKMHHRFQNGFSFEHQIIDCWDSWRYLIHPITNRIARKGIWLKCPFYKKIKQTPITCRSAFQIYFEVFWSLHNWCKVM